MDAQAMVDRFAELAKPRLLELLKLKSTQHVFDPEPARAPATSIHNRHEVNLNRFVRSVQPYKNIERFLSAERVMTYIVDPGLVPLVKPISLDVRGRQLLVTRKIAGTPQDKDAAVAHLNGFGARVLLKIDPPSGEAEVSWECLYGVA